MATSISNTGYGNHAVDGCLSRQLTCGVLEKLALFSLAVRVFMDIGYPYFTKASSGLAALRLDVFVVRIVMAICLVIICIRAYRLSLAHSAAVLLGAAVLVLSSSFAEDSFLLVDLFVVFSVSFVEPRRLCRTYVAAAMASVVLVMAFSLIGQIPMIDTIPNGRLVFGYGFAHPNILAGILLSIIGALTYLCWESNRWVLPLILSLCGALFSYVSLSSNASTILIGLIAFLNLVGHIRIQFMRMPTSLRRLRTPVLVVFPLVLALTMVVLIANYGSLRFIADVADQLTHYRPFYANKYYVMNGGFPLFGRPFVHQSTYHSGTGFFSVDSAYGFVALVFGIVPFVGCCAAYIACVLRARKAQVPSFLVAAILIYALFALVEGHPMHLYSNFTLLLLPCLARTSLGSKSGLVES